ncbi:gas vesicle protein GvpJ [Leifsonia shinshuensis]|uniref:gas vesicle protein GvpJ n=1 Tax=Leifsonia shinshuensis TaxID=150026 RepID=UPI0015C74D12
MQPTRDQKATLGALVDVLLDKGVYLNLDLIITVADVPLIGVNLRATIAGMETMLRYGLMTEWDDRVRAEARRDGSPAAEPFAGELWLLEPRASAPVWREGAAAYDGTNGFAWKAAQDSRPAVRLRPDEITGVRTEEGHGPAGGAELLVIESPDATVRLAGDRVREWAAVLHGTSREVRDGAERR